MKKKLIFGITAASVASLFLACGDGRIIEADDDSGFVNATFLYVDTATLARFVDDAVKSYCSEQMDPDCVAKTSPGAVASDPEVPSSSSFAKIDPNKPLNTGTSTSGTGYSSARQQVPIMINSSAAPGSNPSTNPVIPGSSSSVTIVPSGGSAVTDASAWATCTAAVKDNAVQSGSKVAWTAQPKNGVISMQQMLALKYSWVFAGGAPATATEQKPQVTYTTPGISQTQLVVTLDGQSQTIECPAITVMGASVSGCKCSAAAKTVDFGSASVAAGTNTAIWSVSGCQSTNSAFVYQWSDNLDPTGTMTTVAAQLKQKMTYAPSVKVMNTEFGMMNVPCDSVKFIDGDSPDITLTNGVKSPLETGKTSTLTYKCANANYQAKVAISTQDQNGATVTWAVGTAAGKVVNVSSSQRLTLDYATLFGTPTYNAAFDGAIITVTVNSGSAVEVGCE